MTHKWHSNRNYHSRQSGPGSNCNKGVMLFPPKIQNVRLTTGYSLLP